MLKLDYSVFIQIANFLILIFILNIVLYRPIRKILGQRKHEMSTLQSTTEEYQGRAAHSAEQLEENRVGARREGYKKKEEIRAEGLELEKKIYQETMSSAGDSIERARAEMQRQMGEVRQSLQAEVGVFSRELAEKVLGRSM
jgi:F-type H+-transporting ATPase subunit b